MHEEVENCSTVKGFVLGLGIGSLIGASVALLLAPKSGTETRQEIKVAAEQLKTKAGKLAEDVSESGEELVKKSKELLETTKSKITEVVDAGKEALVKKKGEVEECVETLKS